MFRKKHKKRENTFSRNHSPYKTVINSKFIIYLDITIILFHCKKEWTQPTLKVLHRQSYEINFKLHNFLQ